MSVRGLHHVSVNVDDVRTAVAFYTDLLGLTPIDRPSSRDHMPDATTTLSARIVPSAVSTP